MVNVDVPEFNDTPEACRSFSDFGKIRRSSLVARHNRLVRSKLQGMHADVKKREAIGLTAKKNLLLPILATSERGDVDILVRWF